MAEDEVIGSGRGGGGRRGGVSEREDEDSASSSSQRFPWPLEDLPPFSLPLGGLASFLSFAAFASLAR